MSNQELTLDQLAAFSGGGVFAKLDGFKQIIHPDFRPRGLDVGPISRRGRISAEPLPSPAPRLMRHNWIGIFPLPSP